MTTWTRARYVGVDLANRVDFTAITVLDELEPEQTPKGRIGEPRYVISFMERHRGKPYAWMVDRMAALASRDFLAGQPWIVDCTGVGASVVEDLRTRMDWVHAVVLTGGEQVVRAGPHESHVPKKDVVDALRLLFWKDLCEVDGRIPEAVTLRSEIELFRYQIGETGRLSTGASSGHDDLLLSACLAAWYATREGSNGAAAWGALMREWAAPRAARPSLVTPREDARQAAYMGGRPAGMH